MVKEVFNAVLFILEPLDFQIMDWYLAGFFEQVKNRVIPLTIQNHHEDDAIFGIPDHRHP